MDLNIRKRTNIVFSIVTSKEVLWKCDLLPANDDDVEEEALEVHPVKNKPERLKNYLLAVLWILATPDSYRSVEQQFDMAKSSLSAAFFRIVKALNSLAHRVIKWPTREDIHIISEQFYRSAGVDNVIGAIDGIFVSIKAPKVDAEVYITRKCNFAFTLQATCDAKLKFIDCYVGYPGSVSDTRIFRNSDLYENVSQNKNRFFPDENLFIIGDKAYPLLDWCIPPYIDRGNLNAAKRNFNLQISQTRQVIERAFALLFGRFRRLKYLDMNRIDFIPPVILASCVLHNLCLSNDDLQIDEYVAEGRENVVGNDNIENIGRIDENIRNGYNKRENICRNLYEMAE
ncbi:hypothetical protein NQ314_010747 [Rhamnusium bicolor]|uniref:DDE Tnp4 domain-containing protein n=1 Tax=Rhamnusium bicolor TaxID=1586634 RepID=A0AAV8XP42_9CUCU|nr:hypothetical protein NQ314_010747 [Rhamnusium bicolor]